MPYYNCTCLFEAQLDAVRSYSYVVVELEGGLYIKVSPQRKSEATNTTSNSIEARASKVSSQDWCSIIANEPTNQSITSDSLLISSNQ